MKDQDFKAIFDAADAAGKAAVAATVPTPMEVYTPKSLFDNAQKPGTKTYTVATGPCGMAWVSVKPRNSAFAKWLVRTDNGLRGEKDIMIHANTGVKGPAVQSAEYNSAYAAAFANVLRQHGINATFQSRDD